MASETPREEDPPSHQIMESHGTLQDFPLESHVLNAWQLALWKNTRRPFPVFQNLLRQQCKAVVKQQDFCPSVEGSFPLALIRTPLLSDKMVAI